MKAELQEVMNMLRKLQGVFESDREYLVSAASLAVIAYVLAGFPWKPVSGDD